MNTRPKRKEDRFLKEKEYGNQVLFLELGPADSGKRVEVRYQVKRLEKAVYAARMPVPKKYIDPEIPESAAGVFRAIAESVVEGKKGDLVRARAARFTIGASIPSERNEGAIDGYHCWAEFLADGKWWPVDISEGDKYTALATYYFGHHPANRFELKRGRDLLVEPGPASGPMNFLAYPVLEVGGQPVKADVQFSFTRNASNGSYVG